MFLATSQFVLQRLKSEFGRTLKLLEIFNISIEVAINYALYTLFGWKSTKVGHLLLSTPKVGPSHRWLGNPPSFRLLLQLGCFYAFPLRSWMWGPNCWSAWPHSCLIVGLGLIVVCSKLSGFRGRSRVGPNSCRVGPSAPTAGWPPRRRQGGGGRHSRPGPHPTLHCHLLKTFPGTALHSLHCTELSNALRSENWAHCAKEAWMEYSAKSGVSFVPKISAEQMGCLLWVFEYLEQWIKVQAHQPSVLAVFSPMWLFQWLTWIMSPNQLRNCI